MDHRHGAVTPGDIEEFQYLTIIELQIVVGHVQFERGVAFLDQARQVVRDQLLRRIADDQVKGVVDDRLACGSGMVVRDDGGHGIAFELARKRNHRRRTAASGRPRSGEKIIGENGAIGGRLIEMTMRIDTARDHQLAARVDLGSGRG